MQNQILKTILDKEYNWDLSWHKHTKSTCNHHSLSPNQKWLILGLTYKQEPEDRYESKIEDSQFILFHLHSPDPGNEIARFTYYYNYNSCADHEQESGSRYQWGQAGAELILKNVRLDLETLRAEEIQEALLRI